MIKKILTVIFNCWFYLFRGCCHNCINHNICKNMEQCKCSFMEDNEYPNYYKINKESFEYKYLIRKFFKKFNHNK